MDIQAIITGTLSLYLARRIDAAFNRRIITEAPIKDTPQKPAEAEAEDKYRTRPIPGLA
jgi:hypothetical protein